MQIFITGGSGFVGGHLIRWFSSKGYYVRAMSRGQVSDEKIIGNGGHPVRCDLNLIEVSHLKNIDVVIHAAASVGKWQTRTEYFEINVIGTSRMLQVSKEAGVTLFIFISTESVLFYGSDLININEKTPYPRHSQYDYSLTKMEAEKLVVHANQPEVFQTVSLRPRLIWGPGEPHFIPKIIEAVKMGKFWWIDNGIHLTSTTHVYNLCNACEKVILNSIKQSVLFVTDGEIISFNDFFSRLLEAHGISNIPRKSLPGWLTRIAAFFIEFIWRSLRIKSYPPITRIAAATFATNCVVDDSLARKELGIKPIFSIDMGMNEIINGSHG